MKKLILSTVASLAVVGTLSASETLDIHPGWQLLGSSNSVEDVASIFNDSSIKTVWTFDSSTQSWKVYSPDTQTMQLINNSQSVSPLNSISQHKGFWINSTGDTTITLNSASDLPNFGSNYNAFSDNISDVNISTLADKTFEMPNNTYNENKSFKTISFNDDASAQFIDKSYGCYNGDSNTTSATITLKLVDGALRVSEPNDFRDYKILAQDDAGIVFGATDIDNQVNWKGENLPPVLVFINENSVGAIPAIDMSSLLPYKAYHIWDKDSYTSYEQNGTVVDYYGDGANIDEDGSFNVVDGKISATQSETWEDGGYKNNYVLQTIYTIGHYDVNKVDYNGGDYRTVVNYEDENGSDNDFNLTANPDVDTWKKLFAQTNWTLYGTKYYDNNGTTDNGSTFTISNDGKVLSTNYNDSCGHEDNQTIESGKIYHKHNGVWIDVSSSTPIYKTNDAEVQGSNDSTALEKKLNSKKSNLNYLPPYLRKAILKK